jgi:Domain of unknown function (DUF4303)
LTIRRSGPRPAARRAFQIVREAHPGERFYAFALCTDIEQMRGMCASANTEEGLKWRLDRRLKRKKSFRDEEEAAVAKAGIAWDDYLNYYRWNLPEWAYHGIEGSDFLPLILMLSEPLENLEDDPEESDPEGFNEHRARVCGTMILAMKDLDDEGFFGSGAERESIVLLADLVEPPEKYWFAVESARRLNPPRVFDGFRKQWLAWLTADDRAIIDDPAAHSPIYRPLRALLDGAT